MSADILESSVNDATNQALKKYQYTMVDRYKQELKEALERYEHDTRRKT